MTADSRERSVVEGVHFQTGKKLSLRIEGGRIAKIESGEVSREANEIQVAPGMVDLQINGYGGMDFNSPSVDRDLIVRAAQALWGEGVTTFYPTIITNSDEAIERAVRAIVQASQDALIRHTLAGIHLEGPFISPQDGPRGAHDKAYVKEPDWDLFRRWQEAACGSIRIVTLSPEWDGSARFISRCVESGVIVSIGHTAASPQQIREAVAAGATMSTHLGNGSHIHLPRHHNYLWEQLAQDALWATIIADGFHLPEAVLKVFMRIKNERAMLVSDATSFAGMSPGEYEAHIGERVVLSPEGKLYLAGNPDLLAGSARTLREDVEHLAQSGLCTLPEAWERASVRPASFMGLAQGRALVVGAPADVVLFRQDGGAKGGIEILETYKQGRRVYGEVRHPDSSSMSP